jgi:hypothetical protein
LEREIRGFEVKSKHRNKFFFIWQAIVRGRPVSTGGLFLLRIVDCGLRIADFGVINFQF